MSPKKFKPKLYYHCHCFHMSQDGYDDGDHDHDQDNDYEGEEEEDCITIVTVSTRATINGCVHIPGIILVLNHENYPDDNDNDN